MLYWHGWWEVILLLPLPSIWIDLYAGNYITTISNYANKKLSTFNSQCPWLLHLGCNLERILSSQLTFIMSRVHSLLPYFSLLYSYLYKLSLLKTRPGLNLKLFGNEMELKCREDLTFKWNSNVTPKYLMSKMPEVLYNHQVREKGIQNSHS